MATVPLRDVVADTGRSRVHPSPEVGFYGKLPSHGDFLRRRVSDAFVGVWDAWLQECLAASRASLGDRWLDVYLTSPVWRFACAAGDEPVVGCPGVHGVCPSSMFHVKHCVILVRP